MRKYFLLGLVILFVIFETNERKFNTDVLAKSAFSDIDPSLKPELVMQTGHAKTIDAVVFSPNNSWVASGSFDNTIKIWETESGRELRSLTGHEGAVNCLAVSPDGRWLVSGGNDRAVKIWDVEKGVEIKTFSNQSGAIETVAFSPDGAQIASGGADKSITIRDASSGQEVAKLSEHTDSVTALAYSRDGKILASGSADNTIKIWDLEKKRALRTIKAHAARISSLAFDALGENLVSGSEDKTLRVWKVSSGKSISDFSGQNDCVLAVGFTADDKTASIDSSRAVKIWDSTKSVKVVSPNANGCNGEAQSASFSQDKQFAAIGNGDGTVSLTNVKTGEILKTLENHTSGNYGVAFSNNRRWLASANYDNTVKLWDLQTGQSVPPLRGHTGRVTAVAFHPDNQRVVSASLDGTVKVWDVSTGKILNSLEGHKDTIGSLAVGGKGKLIVSGSKDQTARLWNLDTSTSVVLNGHTGEVTAVAISPDEKFIATGSADKTVKLWDAGTQKLITTFKDNTDAVTSIAFNQDGKQIATGSADKTIRVWETATGRALQTISGNPARINTVAFSPDGKQIAAGGEDNSVNLWNAATGERVWATTPHVGAVFSLSFTSDNRWLASSSADGVISICKTENGKPLATLVTLKNGNDWLVATPEGIFDGSPASWEQIIWRFGKNTFNVKPVEVFFKEFYLPGLLAKVLNDGQLPLTSNIVNKDRRQPTVKISLADGKTAAAAISERQVKVKINVAEVPPGDGYQTGSGARDIRLFRNGLLVKQWSGNNLTNGSLELETPVSLVKGQNQLTAYAYNNDNIKSVDAQLKLQGAESLARKGVFYIVAIAVSQYANPKYNLTFIDSEAKEFAEQLRSNLSQTKQYERVEVITLLNQEATKNNILNAFKKLGGNKLDQPENTLPASFSKIQTVQPEDAVAVFFTGHGESKDQHSYILPYDFTDAAHPVTEKLMPTILKQSVSDLELEDAFSGMDVGHLVLVLDACKSGDALTLEDERQAPINMRGLGQLAYEKGMFIITASQGNEYAYVSPILKRSYLSYALTDEGLKTNEADVSPKDGQLSIREWFDFAANRVPQLRVETNEIALRAEKSKGLEEVSGNNPKPQPKKELVETVSTQRPRVFYRRQNDLQSLTIASVK